MNLLSGKKKCGKKKSGSAGRLCMGLWGILLAAVMLSGCGKEEGESGDLSGQETAPSEETSQPEEAVVFEARDMNGNTVTSDIFSQSKLTMVNVWATYCNPCLSEMPELGELAGEYGQEEFRLIGIVSDVMEGAEQEELDNAAELIEQTGADYTHLLLNQSLYNALLYDVSAVPTTFFIDENGKVLGGVVGAREKAVWKEIIDGLLEEL